MLCGGRIRVHILSRCFLSGSHTRIWKYHRLQCAQDQILFWWGLWWLKWRWVIQDEDNLLLTLWSLRFPIKIRKVVVREEEWRKLLMCRANLLQTCQWKVSIRPDQYLFSEKVRNVPIQNPAQVNPEEKKEPFFARHPPALGPDPGASEHLSNWENSWFFDLANIYLKKRWVFFQLAFKT